MRPVSMRQVTSVAPWRRRDGLDVGDRELPLATSKLVRGSTESIATVLDEVAAKGLPLGDGSVRDGLVDPVHEVRSKLRAARDLLRV